MEFSEWIKGFEERYSPSQLWFMKWIWEIAPKLNPVKKDLTKEHEVLKVFVYHMTQSNRAWFPKEMHEAKKDAERLLLS